MRIMLVNPNNRIISKYAGIEQPLWLGCIASDLIRKGNEVRILDAEVLDLTLDETVEQIRDYSPDELILVVLGSNPSVTSTPKMGITKKIVDYLIGDMKIKITGLHPSALPKQTENELGVEVLRGKVFEGTPDLPYHLLPMDKYISHFWHCLDNSPRQPYAVTYSSMNCPWHCSFCNIKALYDWKDNVFYRDIDSFIREIDLLVNIYNVRNIKLWDEHFTTNKKRVMEICDKLIKQHYDLNIWAYARVDTVDQEMLDKMWQAGITWLGYGFESGSDTVLNRIDKRANRNQAFHAVKMTHDAGINVMGNFILGLPNDTLETMQSTMKFAKSLDIEFINLYVSENLPGSEIFKQQEKDWAEYGQFSPLQKRDKIVQFRNAAFNDYFLDSNYLAHIDKLFGKQAVLGIKDMIVAGKPVTRSVV